MRVNRDSSLFVALSPVHRGACAHDFRPELPSMIDHIHLAAPDPVAAVAWYQKYFGGQTMAEATDRLLIGDVRVIFSKRRGREPSQGSAIDHIGFSVPNSTRR